MHQTRLHYSLPSCSIAMPSLAARQFLAKSAQDNRGRDRSPVPMVGLFVASLASVLMWSAPAAALWYLIQ